MESLQDVKFICSCVRDYQKLIQEFEINKLLLTNDRPKAGDIVIVKVLDEQCGYTAVENSYGRLVNLYNGDVFIGVLGNRRSGTNIVGKVPAKLIKAGDNMDLLSQGGLLVNVLALIIITGEEGRYLLKFKDLLAIQMGK